MLLCSQTNKGKEKCAKTKRNFNDNRMVKSEHFCSFLRLHTKVKCVACVVLCNTMCETLKCDARCPLPHISSSRPTTHFCDTFSKHCSNKFFGTSTIFFLKFGNYYFFNSVQISNTYSWTSIQPNVKI